MRSEPLAFGTLVRTELPTDFTVWFQSVVNCADASASQTVLTSKQTAHSESLTVSRSVTNTLGATIGAGASFSGFGVSGSVTITKATSTGTARLEGTQEITIRTGSGAVAIKARSTAIAEFRVWPINFELPFTTTVLVDADLSDNDRGLKRLSEVLPEAKRTFPIEGHIASREASDGEIIFHAAENDPAKCDPGAAVVVADHPPDAQTRLILGDRLPSIPAR